MDEFRSIEELKADGFNCFNCDHSRILDNCLFCEEFETMVNEDDLCESWYDE